MGQSKKDFDRAIQSPAVQKILKKLATEHGWPKPVAYQCSREDWEVLSQIPGSFATEEKLPEECPISGPALAEIRAFYDLLPSLIEEHRDRYVAFGYGRHWYELGDTPIEAMKKLIKNHPYQMPRFFGPITEERMNSWDYKDYYAWKEKQSAALKDSPESHHIPG